MQKNCQECNANFEITDEDLKYYKKFSPEIAGEKLEIPPPKFCPECRQQRRLAFRNERKLYKRNCDLCNKSIVSSYDSSALFPVYCNNCWFSAEWDSLSFGKDFDFSKTFFEQFLELRNVVPRPNVISTPDIVKNNSEYTNFAGNNRNCYMIFDSDFNEDSCYSNVLKHSRVCYDCSFTEKSELCYQCINCSNCYNTRYSEDCTNCSDSSYLKNCIGCSNCFLSSNLRNKKYYFQNKSYPKEQYQEMIAKYHSDPASFAEQIKNFKVGFVKEHHNLKTENAHGDYILNAKNIYSSFNVSESEDLRYCDLLYRAKDCMDVSSFGEKIECVLDSETIGLNCFNLLFCYCTVDGDRDLIYSDSVRQSKNCFGCISLHRKEYCILNKQYSKEEYEELVPRIIEHMQKNNEWGEFFPTTLSPYGYNETVAQEFFPLSKEEVLQKGWQWKDEKDVIPNVTKIIPAEKLPNKITEIPDDILNWAIKCEKTQRPYKIQKSELEFYRKMNLPIPHFHPDERHKMRMKKINPRKLWDRKCAKCTTDIQTTYSPEREEKVLCEKCYLQEVD